MFLLFFPTVSGYRLSSHWQTVDVNFVLLIEAACATARSYVSTVVLTRWDACHTMCNSWNGGMTISTPARSRICRSCAKWW